MDRIVSRFNTISDVDAEIDRVLSVSPILITSKLTRFELPFFNASPALRRLLVLKELYGVHNTVDRNYTKWAQQNRAARWDTNSRCLEDFKKAFEEIVELTTNRYPAFGGDLSNARAHHFLDLGCAPGGFAAWLLQNTPMQGTGITLPLSANGIPMHSGLRAFDRRFRTYEEDVCQIARGQYSATTGRWDDHIPPAGFDIIIANAVVMLAEDAPTLLVAFKYIATGETLVISLRTRPFDSIIDIIAMLTEAFKSVNAVKPRYQAKTSFAYVVCQGFKATADTKHWYLDRLRAVIRYLDDITAGHVDTTCGTCLPRLSGTPSGPETLPFIVDLFTFAWKCQYDAIHNDYERVLSASGSAALVIPATVLNPQPSAAQSCKSLLHDRTRMQIPVARSNATSSSDWRSRLAEPQQYDEARRHEEKNAGFRDLFRTPQGASDRQWR